MRDYVAGDEIRRIDWKASSRRNRPQIRQYQTDRSAEVILAIDCGRLMGSLIDGVTKLDLTLTPVLDLCAVILPRGERVGLLAFDSKPRVFLPPRGGLQNLSAMTTALSELPTEPDEPTSYLRAVRYLESRHRKRSLVVVFTDFTDELTGAEMFSSFSALSRRHTLVFVGVGDPHLQEIATAPSSQTRGHMQKAVAAELLVERSRAFHRMESDGILTIDAQPDELTGPLIQRYLEVRLRGLV
ncbi:MAG: DUF58 domain-containing protein [Planctomycetota bacterium]